MKLPTACILVVEDHEDSRAVLEIQLRLIGYSVVAVADYDEAIKQAKENRFDLYLLDHRLFKGNGFDLRQQLKAISPTTPALFCTATHYPLVEINELRQRGDDFLLKPVDAELLKSSVANLIEPPA